MKKIIFFICCLIAISCKEDNNSEVKTLFFDVDNLSKQVSFFDIFERVDIIPLETSKNSMLTPAIMFDIYNDTTYVMDFINNKNIKMFDSKGKYLSVFCNKGEAPDDYVMCNNISVNSYTGNFEMLDNNNTLNIFNRKTKKKIETVKLADKKSVPAQECFAINANNYLLFSGLTDKENIWIYNAKTKQNTYLTYHVDENIVGSGKYYSMSFFRKQNNDDITFNTLYDRNIYKYEEGKINKFICLDFGEKHNMDSYVSQTNSAEQVKDILNDHKKEIVSHIFLPIFFGDNFYCTVSVDRNNITLFSDGKLKKQYCIEKTKEDLLLPVSGGKLDGDMLYFPVQERGLKDYVNEKVLDTKNMEILKNIKEDDNPVVLRYKLKDF